jgi:hypothetical protein
MSTRWRINSPQGQGIVQQLEVRRSNVRSIRVNFVATTTLSLELCSKFLIELPPPVNIAYWRRIMSRDRDIPVLNRCHFMKEPRVVDATG